jgi:hypothetical protein
MAWHLLYEEHKLGVGEALGAAEALRVMQTSGAEGTLDASDTPSASDKLGTDKTPSAGKTHTRADCAPSAAATQALLVFLLRVSRMLGTASYAAVYARDLCDLHGYTDAVLQRQLAADDASAPLPWHTGHAVLLPQAGDTGGDLFCFCPQPPLLVHWARACLLCVDAVSPSRVPQCVDALQSPFARMCGAPGVPCWAAVHAPGS